MRYTPLATDALCPIPARSPHVTEKGYISVNEVLTSVHLIGTTDAITFEAFIIRKLVPKLGKGACVVMDNCTIHTG
jgi:hypothetical protein